MCIRDRPRPKTSILPSAQETAAGDAVNCPLRDSQVDQVPLLYERCQSAWSEPMTKTSSCPARCELAAGPVVAASCPPRDDQADQEAPPSELFLHQSALSVPRAKTSICPAAQETAAGDAVNCPLSDAQVPHSPARTLTFTTLLVFFW